MTVSVFLTDVLFYRLDDGIKKQVTVLYNSSLSFSKRLYECLDVGLSPVNLHQPLDTILKEPLVFIGNMVPYTCLQALLRYGSRDHTQQKMRSV